jgi:hypothetical protein
MAYDLQIIDNQNNIKFECKRIGLKSKEKISILPYSIDGKPLQRKNVNPDTLEPVTYTTKYLDDTGKAYEKSEVIWKDDQGEIGLTEATKVFEIIAYRPLSDWLDKYLIDNYQEIYPANGSGEKKISDVQKNKIKLGNTLGMRKLWEKLHSEHVIGEASEFNLTTGSTRGKTAFIRAVSKMVLENNELKEKWGFEIGITGEEKEFKYLMETSTPTATEASAPRRVVAGIRRV